ncbi:hypothetical protein VKT23_017563 [Stygiomarasmius scandens]|uniref:MYND-type domain-containing protein n=1 Tax=Marasmiellus scandens TaxID=2682957 RepID=A0ABR1IRQ3_9AGAR
MIVAVSEAAQVYMIEGKIQIGSLAAAYQNLKLHPPSPSCNLSHPSRKMVLALSSLCAITHEMVFPCALDRQRTRNEYFETHWTQIWIWTSILLRDSLNVTEFSTEWTAFQDRLLFIFPMILSLPCRALVRGTSDVFASAVQALMFCLERSHPALSTNFIVFDVIFTDTLNFSGLSSHAFQPIMDAKGFFETLISYIRVETRKRDCSFACLKCALDIIVVMAEASDMALDDILSHDAIQCLSLALRHFTNPHKFAKLDGEQLEQCTGCIKFILLFFSGTFQAYGPPAVSVALRCNLIISVINACNLVYDNKDSSIEFFVRFFETIHVMLCYRGVLNPVLGSMRKLHLNGAALDSFLQKNVPSSSDKNRRRLGVAWELLVKHATGIEKIKREFESQGLIICANSRCGWRGLQIKSRFQRSRCAKCQTTIYCSANCQRQDWKNHRSVCDAVRYQGACYYFSIQTKSHFLAFAGVLRSVFTDIDRMFLGWYCLNQIVERRSAINSALRRYAKRSGTDGIRIVMLNLCTVPAGITVMPLEDHEDEMQKMELEGRSASSNAVLSQLEEGYQTVIHTLFCGWRNVQRMSIIHGYDPEAMVNQRFQFSLMYAQD